MCAQELRLFSLGLLIKIALLAICGSLMLEEFFGPVVEHYLSSFPNSPYKHFNEASQSEKFPYPALMLYVLTLVNLFLGWSKDLLFSEIWIYRLPLLVSDVIIFSVLYSWLRDKERIRLIFFYWFSPVLIYINFVHGQLDSIPMALLFCLFVFPI